MRVRPQRFVELDRTAHMGDRLGRLCGQRFAAGDAVVELGIRRVTLQWRRRLSRSPIGAQKVVEGRKRRLRTTPADPDPKPVIRHRRELRRIDVCRQQDHAAR